MSNSRELLQTFFWSPRAPSLSHCIWSLVYCNSLSLVLCLLLVPVKPSSSLPLLSAATVPSMLMASPSYAVIPTVISLYRSFHLSFTCSLSHSLGVRVALSFLMTVSQPRDIKSRCGLNLTLWNNIFLISRISV